jgi:hypothetical protein
VEAVSTKAIFDHKDRGQLQSTPLSRDFEFRVYRSRTSWLELLDRNPTGREGYRIDEDKNEEDKNEEDKNEEGAE